MNDSFLDEIFVVAERNNIQMVNVSADKKLGSTIVHGSDTQDKVFLLSIEEAEKYFESNASRQYEATLYAKDKGTFTSESNRNSRWWLRTLGEQAGHIAEVYNVGRVSYFGQKIDSEYLAIRPVIWSSLEP